MSLVPASFSGTWGHGGPYHDFSRWSRSSFGERIQKISVDIGKTCPNRDGTIGTAGCAFCRVDSFVPSYCNAEQPAAEQVVQGMDFFRAKYPGQRYLVYFQAFSATHGDRKSLSSAIEEVLSVDGVAGIIVGTRPDLIDDAWASYFGELSERAWVCVELGVQSSINQTLVDMNRGHDFSAVQKACARLAIQGVRIGAHLIFGLPGESPTDWNTHAQALNRLPILTLKIHHLQILKGTPYAVRFSKDSSQFPFFEPEEYVEWCADFLEQLRPDIVVERFCNESPPDMVVHPHWAGVRNYQISAMVSHVLARRGSWQGRLWNGERDA